MSLLEKVVNHVLVLLREDGAGRVHKVAAGLGFGILSTEAQVRLQHNHAVPTYAAGVPIFTQMLSFWSAQCHNILHGELVSKIHNKNSERKRDFLLTTPPPPPQGLTKQICEVRRWGGSIKGYES
jgi:hypothetical protein